MTKNKTIFSLIGTSGLFFVMALTHNNRLLGTILGYWIAVLYVHWLYKGAQNSMNLDILNAIGRMRRNFFARLGFITLAVAIVGRFQKDWLLNLAIGIALGLVVSFVVGIIEYIEGGKG